MPDFFPHKPGGPGPKANASTEPKFDQASFEIFFKENYASLCAYCQFRYDFDLDTANEAVHSAFVKLWENRHVITRSLSKKAYVISIVNNNCIDLLRHNKVKRQHADYHLSIAPISINATGGGVDEKKITEDIQRAVAELPLQMRTIFQLSRFEGLKNNEIAMRLHISVKTVETQMTRALTKLRRILSDYSSYILLALFLGQ